MSIFLRKESIISYSYCGPSSLRTSRRMRDSYLRSAVLRCFVFHLGSGRTTSVRPLGPMGMSMPIPTYRIAALPAVWRHVTSQPMWTATVSRPKRSARFPKTPNINLSSALRCNVWFVPVVFVCVRSIFVVHTPRRAPCGFLCGGMGRTVAQARCLVKRVSRR